LRKYVVLIVAVVMLLSIAGCGKQENVPEQITPESVQTQEPEASPKNEEPLETEVQSRFSPVYVKENGNGEIETIEITQFADFLIIEHGQWAEGDLYSYWADEFWPDDSGDLYSDKNVISGHYASFSNMSNVGLYWAEPAVMTIMIQEDSITISAADEGNYSYVPDTTAERIHSDVSSLKPYIGCTPDKGFAGNWYVHENGYTAFIRLYEDGRVECVSKSMEMPIVYLMGVWGADNGKIEIIGTVAGSGDMPYEISWEVSVNGSEFEIKHDSDILLPWEGTATAMEYDGLPSIPSPSI